MNKIALPFFLMVLFSTHCLAAALEGMVFYEGDIPKSITHSVNSDRHCAISHPEGLTQSLLSVSARGALDHVFVYLEPQDALVSPSPQSKATLNQVGCRYEPHILGLQLGQSLEIVNSDNTLHNVRASAKKNKSFNIGMPLEGMKVTKKFKKSEIMVKMKCDVHPWMNAYVGVLPHSYFSVARQDAGYRIRDIPAGQYTVRTWHETLGELEHRVNLTENETATHNFQY